MKLLKNILVKSFSVIALSIWIISCSPEKEKIHIEEQDDKHNNMLILSDKDRFLANIKTDSAVVKNISEITTLVGKTVIDELKIEVVTARVKGRIDKLFVRNAGEYVKQGQLIYSIYSEELLADESDYLLAKDQYANAIAQKEIAGELLEAARKKLILWTLTQNQINELGNSKTATPLINFYSSYSGYVIELSVREGEYVDAGSPLLRLADLSTLWIETQIYSDEVKYLSQNPSLQIEFEAYPNELFKGEIVFDNPVLEDDQKVNLIRVKVFNSDHKLKPGMMAYLYLERNEKKTLVIPKSSLLLGSVTSVWVENRDGMFEQRMVKTGVENKNEVEILFGIAAGERVVISGAFFLQSANIVKQGGGNMGGMKM